MANQVKKDFLDSLQSKFGNVKKLNNSLSLFDIGDGASRIYIRYSRVHNQNKTFYGLREKDLKELEGKNALIIFLWDNQKEPLSIPFSEFEEVFGYSKPAADGQYKVQIYLKEDGTEFYIAGAGRFNVENFFGWEILENQIDKSKIKNIPKLSHSQIQTCLGFIGNSKGYDIWIPASDRTRLDWSFSKRFEFKRELPIKYKSIFDIVNEIDVIWLKRGANEIKSLFEIEHSTPIYSGLLRFNDFHLIARKNETKFSIVSNDARKSLFTKQINRPTFQISGLSELCNFLEYRDVFGWYKRMQSKKY